MAVKSNFKITTEKKNDVEKSKKLLVKRILEFRWGCMCVCCHFNRVWLFATPWTAAHQASPPMGFSRQEYWSGLAFPSPRDLPDPGIKPTSLMPPALAGRFFATRTTWEALWWGIQFSSAHSLSHVHLFATPWTAALKASLSITNSQSLLKFMSIRSVMPSNYLILYHPILLPPSIFPSIRVFSSESVLHIKRPK